MNKYLSASLNNVSMDLSSSWAAQTFREALGLGNANARFQQKQLQEKEEKLVKLYENQQQRAFDKVGRSSAGSTTSLAGGGGGKVRQMFDERRQKAGIDKSYPLEPLKSKSNSRITPDRRNGVVTKTSVKSTVQNGFSAIKNGKPIAKKREIVERLYENNNGKESYEENRYESDNNQLNHSKSHREFLEISNNHNSHDYLDSEEMPQFGFDDEIMPNNKSRNSNNNNNSIKNKVEAKSNGVVQRKNSALLNGNSNQIKNENTQTKKYTTTNNKKSDTQTQPIKTSARNTPTSPLKNSQLNMGDRVSDLDVRTPHATRTTDKQQAPRAVVARDDLNECNYCGRRFAQDRIRKHEEICAKTGKKKRKPYDATKHRVIGTELESYVMTRVSKGRGSVPTKTTRSSLPSTKKDWRRTHEEFISTIRAAKMAQAHIAKGGKLSDLPPPPPSSNPDYVQCPHCNRRFNESAAERHIPKCADYQFNKPKPSSKSKLRK